MEFSTIALTIAGSDPSGGAGIQNDLKVFSAMGVYGTSVIATLTVQNTQGVQANHPVHSAIVQAQIENLFQDFSIVAAKTGALGSVQNIQKIGRFFANKPDVKLVVDPVIYSSSGTLLVDGDAIEALLYCLVPYAFLVTPNLSELRALTHSEQEATSVEEVMYQAKILVQKGARAVLAKGGHLQGNACDVLVTSEGVEVFSAPRIQTQCTHGTGCTLSAAITALLARGFELPNAVRLAKEFLTEAMQFAKPMGSGVSALHPLFLLKPWV